MRRLVVFVLAALVAGVQAAHAFCGFYVSGSDKKLFNDATQVVLMRDGTRTVLSMQNDYQGPLEDFAMVVPVPVVLHEKDVKTLPKAVFDHVDALGSPRLVEYWEQDPCYIPPPPAPTARPVPKTASHAAEDYDRAAKKATVKIEAKFAVGEYEILILSAKDSSGLEYWLRDNHYKIPAGAEPLLRPYVESGMKFFVAKVDPRKVTMAGGHAALSPLRFSYDSDDFSLPIRLGMANSSGKQDLIVNIISADKRYEVANYKNVTVPTNFDVKPEVRDRFGEFYAALFDKTVEANPGAVVTEYAWTAQPPLYPGGQGYHCDPCPPVEVDDADMMTLGADIIGGKIQKGGFVLTRLHARYSAGDMKDDLRFRAAAGITGGRETRNWDGELEHGASPSGESYFQARYAIRHHWTGPVTCSRPRWGIWGGPPDGRSNQMVAATKLAFAPRGALSLPSVITKDIPEIGVKKSGAARSGSGGGSGGFATPPTRRLMGLGLGALVAFAMIGLFTWIRSSSRSARS
ncbi:MAG TPA: DUF2330 domain-containing protein [Kofleriaceae bacterium]|nr:DUF2330 domain-containing protein [Kofleriaceae bacterium]